jgi:hypothetical protein
MNTSLPTDLANSFASSEPGQATRELDETTRLVVRERYAYKRPWARLLVEPTELVSFVMSQKMLRGIRDRAERPLR